MGSGLSLSRGIRLTKDKCYRTDSNRNQFKLDAVVLTRSEVDKILEDDTQKSGTYVLYEDLERDKTCLAFRTVDGKVAHYPITKRNDLYYFNDFPFPYLESIVLYYKKYKFKDTKLTNQVCLEPYIHPHEIQRRSMRSMSLSVNALNEEPCENGKEKEKKNKNENENEYYNDKTWTYGQYTSLLDSTRL